MLETVHVSSRGQVVIPDAARKLLNIQKNTKLVLLAKDGKLVLEKEETFIKKLEAMEKLGWQKLAEKSLAKTWANKKDEENWSKYL